MGVSSVTPGKTNANMGERINRAAAAGGEALLPPGQQRIKRKGAEHMRRQMISIIVPCYNEEQSLPLLMAELDRVYQKMSEAYGVDFEILLIDDGSRDGTLSLLCKYAEEDPKVRYISFSRNFGKEAALLAGFQHAGGDFAIAMDADLQHPPALLEEMYLAISREGYDTCGARRISRTGEPRLRSLFSRWFSRLAGKLTQTGYVEGATDYRMLSRPAIDALLQLGEYNRFTKGMFEWIGFRTKWIPYENVQRVAGKTAWSFWGLLKYSINGIMAFSDAPLHIASAIGILFCLAALIGLVFIVVKTLAFGEPVPGYPTLACLLLMVGGSLQLSLGIMGQYLAKTYMETKRRPLYIIRKMGGGGAAETKDKDAEEKLV